MNSFKNIRWVALVLLVLLVLVVIRVSNKNLFKQDAEKSVLAGKTNTVTFRELENLKQPFVVVNISSIATDSNLRFNSIQIPLEKLLEKENRGKLENTQGKILLFSEDISVSTKAWVILNQLNFDNVFILVQENPEVLKYKFRPDTTVGPELND